MILFSGFPRYSAKFMAIVNQVIVEGGRVIVVVVDTRIEDNFP